MLTRDAETLSFCPGAWARYRSWRRPIRPGVEVVNAADVANFEDVLRDVDLVLYENGDSERCRLVEETARRLKKPWIYAEAHGGSGMTVCSYRGGPLVSTA